jgi:hypothetical protein
MLKHTKLHKWRNVLVAFLVSTVALVGCSKNDDANPDVSVAFESTSYAIPQSGEVILRVVATSNVAANTTIPYTISGNAVKGTDFNVSADAFVILAGTNSAEVKVTTTASFDKTKSIKVDLGNMPAGVVPGSLLFTEVAIAPKDILIYSFEYPNVTMTETADIKLNLQTGVGSYVATQELKIPVVLAEGSTAVEGVHFSFDGPKEVVIPAGKNVGSVKLKFIKQEAGKDLIILKLGAVGNHYAAGNYANTRVTVFGDSYTKLKGTWKYKAFVNYQWLADATDTEGMNDPRSALPTKNTDKDLLIFGEDGLTVQMTGDVKNYFRDGSLTNLGETTERLQEAGGFNPPRVQLQLVKLSNINVAFSATTNKVRAAEVGFRVITETGKNDILEVTVRDFEPTDFMANTYALYKTFDPVLPLKTMPIRYHFERVN